MIKNAGPKSTQRRSKTRARKGARPVPKGPMSPAARQRAVAIKTMHWAIFEAFRATDDIDLVTSEIFMNIGCTMNAIGHDPKALGTYLIAQGKALRHPDATKDGPHLSTLACLATMVGLFPELDALRGKAEAEIDAGEGQD